LRVTSSSSRHDRFDERSLVEAARTDPNAFAELYRRHVDRIYRYAFRRSQSQSVAEDVTSATFEKALKGLPSFRWTEPGIAPWLFRIASNELANHYRGAQRHARAAQSLAEATLTEPAVGFEPDPGHDLLLAALASIKPRYQRALSLRYFADLSNEEAAAAMGVTRATMAVIVHRSAAALRKALDRIDSTEQTVIHD
jgi:RNA polymerase sigma-70 factor (ECF subfamily)